VVDAAEVLDELLGEFDPSGRHRAVGLDASEQLGRLPA
jgi:hypothetical protein